MSKILLLADVHIKLGQKNVPRKWQYDRFMMLADEINKEKNADYIVIAGDLFDVADPSVEEVGLMFDFLARLKMGGIIIPGNHEMTSKTKDCFRFLETMLGSLDFKVIRGFESEDGIDYIPYNVLFKEFPEPQNKLAITHVRGEIPPHVKPEVDLEKFNGYDKVFAGDLHSYTNSQDNIHYPGSPFSTSFHRAIPSGSNGYFVIDTSSTEHRWVELYLPQLIRKTISDPSEMIPTEYHHTIYELEGDLEDLAVVEDNALLDKKVTKNISAPATLNLTGDMTEELATYLAEIKALDEDSVAEHISLFKDIINDSI